jgi:hypothetical protein
VINFVAHRVTRSGFVSWRIASAIALIVLVAAVSSRQSFAQDAQAQALELSDHAFQMLNAINA